MKMKNIITTFCLFLAFSYNGFSQTVGPKIEFQSSVVDYGEIMEKLSKEAMVFASLLLSIQGICP